MYDLDFAPGRPSRAGIGRVHRHGQGVQRHRRKWRARAYDRRLGRTIHLGLYPTEREAVRAVEAWWANRRTPSGCLVRG